MKSLIITAALLFGLSSTLKTTDLDRMTGKKWTGTLTYLDYGTGKWEPVETELTVTKSQKGAGIYNWITTYPKELDHNSSEELVISKDGRYFDGEAVKKCEEYGDTLRFITEKEGNDNHKEALFRFTYIISPNRFNRKKEVCLKNETKWFVRNELSLICKP